MKTKWEKEGIRRERKRQQDETKLNRNIQNEPDIKKMTNKTRDKMATNAPCMNGNILFKRGTGPQEQKTEDACD